ncbi:hypothetical protein [Pseudomonas sp. USHLN015]
MTQDEKDLLWLQCLENAGVDNWSGIDHARDEYRKALKELGEEED